ncbi:hypothetical protein E2542_SST18960 [Spatholobus suberectus]|nr:hypothetical protein E2542_SST18960 [Spatholobus suberectus]
MDIPHVLLKARSLSRAAKENEAQEDSIPRQREVKWKALAGGMIKANFDASVRHRIRTVGYYYIPRVVPVRCIFRDRLLASGAIVEVEGHLWQELSAWVHSRL